MAHRRTHRLVTKLFFRTSTSLMMLAAAAAVFIVVISPTSIEADEDSKSTEVSATGSAETMESPRALSLSGPDLEPIRAIAVESTDDAIAAAAQSSLGMRRLPPASTDYEEVLNHDLSQMGSVSLGTIRDGALKNAVALSSEGDYHEIIEQHRSRNTNYGTEELVSAIERAAKKVAHEHGGAPLRVGNLGYSQGGPIPWSNSHEAGRDVDIAFYSVDDQGRSVPTPGLIAFDDEGMADNGELRFDVPRNWALISALLTDPDIVVQWMFVSTGLKILLIEHALDIEEDPEIIDRAIDVLHQPTDAPPHDDHLHLRIACTKADRLAGCIDWGPHWDWHDWHEPALFARTRKIQRAFDDPSPRIREQALEYLYDIRSPFGPEVALQYGLNDPEAEVRDQAIELLEDIPLRSEAGIELLSSALKTDLDDERRQALYAALRQAQSPRAAQVAMERYGHQELDIDERVLAIEALAHRTDTDLIPELIDALEEESSPKLRKLLAHQLYTTAARDDGVDWSEDPLGDDHTEALKKWRKWWEEEQPDRAQVLEEFAMEHGAREWKDLEVIDDLIPRLRSVEQWERYNLNRIISQWTGRWAPREWDNDNGAYQFWSRWWNRNRDRVLNPTPKPWDDWER